eukprot:COSAG04_NODE_413_length_14740_cov_85.508572_3_plen_65_part_00
MLWLQAASLEVSGALRACAAAVVLASDGYAASGALPSEPCISQRQEVLSFWLPTNLGNLDMNSR